MPDVTVKDILYEQIDKISEAKIHQDIAAKNYSNVINMLLDGCISKLVHTDDETIGTLAESLMHYLLTNALIPSQRKVTIMNNEIDIVIPDSRTLLNSPKDALVLHFVKSSNEKTLDSYLENLGKVQPIDNNILLISKNTTKDKFRTYEIKKNSTFANILNDIDGFISSRPQSKFKIMKN